MTNNSTIDGVSLLPCPFCGGDAVLKQYRADGLEIRCTGCQSMRQQRWTDKGRGWLETKMIEKWNERATPAAEFQEPVVLLSEHREGLAAYLEQIKDQQSTIARLEARITQLESEKEFAAATYQAERDRIAELESGRGEPVAWANGEQLRLCAASPREVQPNNPMMHNLPRNIAGSALKTGYCNTPLYAAPPAPVAAPADLLQRLAYALSQVGKPDHLVDYDAVILAREDLRACLDAAAALNTKPSTEVNP